MDDAGASFHPHLKVFDYKPEPHHERDGNEQYLWKDKTPSIVDTARVGKRKITCDLDFGTLDCSSCTKPLSPRVYQDYRGISQYLVHRSPKVGGLGFKCRNGHTICATCCKKLTNGCPSCSRPIGSNRNIAVEKILASVQVGCKHADQGCQEVLKYTMKKIHEEILCTHRPYHCPVPRCMHNCPKSMLSLHLERVHQAGTFDIINQPSFKVLTYKPYVRLQCGKLLAGLVHHEIWPDVGHVFFCTSFEVFDKLYCLEVKYQFVSSRHAGPKFFNSLETVVYSNQGIKGSVSEVKNRGDFLVIPQLENANFQISQIELSLTISPHCT